MHGVNRTIETDSVVQKGARQLLDKAVRAGVGGIHIEPNAQVLVVRFRRASELYVAAKLPLSYAAGLADYFKGCAGLDIDERSAPQSGSFETTIGERVLNCQVSLLPVIGGEKITLQLRSQVDSDVNVESLGLEGYNLDMIEQALSQPHGLILVTADDVFFIRQIIFGLLQTFHGSSLKVAMINHDEQVVPKFIKGFLVDEELNFDTAHYLKTLSHESYKVIAVDMMTDKKTIEMLSRVQANDRLLIAGVPGGEPSKALQFVEKLSGDAMLRHRVRVVISGKRVPKLCQSCKEPYDISRSERQHFAGQLPSKLWRANLLGCPKCHHSGYSGEMGLFEVLVPSKSDQQTSLIQDLYQKTQAGLVDAPTYLRIT